MKTAKKLFAVILSIIMVISVAPISAFAATPSTKKTASSVASVSSYYIYEMGTKDKCYYFDDLQTAFNYLNTSKLSTITLLKDAELSAPIQFTDKINGAFGSDNTLHFELNGCNVTAPNDNAFEFYDMNANIFVDLYQQAYLSGDSIDRYGTINAKDYAIALYNSNSLVVAGGTYFSQTKDAPFYVDDANGGICNIRKCAIINSSNIAYSNGYFGNEDNVFLRYTGSSAATGDHFAYFHVREGVVNEQSAYIVEDHNFPVDIATDRQSATIGGPCADCGYNKASTSAKALIGDKGYTSLVDAFNSINYGTSAKIEILENTTLDTSLYFFGKDVVIDLNNHTLTHSRGYFQIEKGGKLEMMNGKINSNSDSVFYVTGTEDSTVTEYSTLKLHDLTINNTYSGGGTIVFIANPLKNWSPPSRDYGINVDLDKCNLTSKGSGVQVNGNYHQNNNVLNINECNIKSTVMGGLYLAGYINTNVTNSYLDGIWSAIEIRAGVLNILGTGNTLKSSDDEAMDSSYNDSGATTWATALVVSPHSVGNDITVKVEGGTFEGSLPFAEVNTLRGHDVPIPNVSIEIEGGTFTCIPPSSNGDEIANPVVYDIVDAIYAMEQKGFVSGGTFNREPDKSYIAKGYKAIYDGDDAKTWTIRPAIVFFNSGDDVDCDEEFHEIFSHSEIDGNNQKVESFTSIPKLKDPDSNIFTGWTYTKGDYNTLFNMNDTIDTTRDTNIYANWIPITTMQKAPEDEKNISEYKTFGLAGVQIRQDGTKDKNGNEVYGGLRYIASLSDDLYQALNSNGMQIIEYGFVAASKEKVDANAIGDPNYQIKNGDTNVTKIKCSNAIDHRTFDGKYRLFTMVIDFAGVEELKSKDYVARAYIIYRDANGVQRIFYNDYDGTNVYGGCSISYNDAAAM